jgi:hypothetical protein
MGEKLMQAVEKTGRITAIATLQNQTNRGVAI